jgi:hypothetical protein
LKKKERDVFQFQFSHRVALFWEIGERHQFFCKKRALFQYNRECPSEERSPMKYSHIFVSIVSILALSVSAHGATSFSDSLRGGSLPGGFNLADGSAGRAPTYDGSGVTFAFDGDGGGNYLRTNETDYDTIGFTAYLTVTTRLGTSFDNDTQLFFGISTGAVGQYGVPDRLSNSGVYITVNDENALGFAVKQAPSDSTITGIAWSGADTTQQTTTAVRLIYDAVGDTVQYDLDFNYAGDATYAAFSTDQSSGTVAIPAAVLTGWAGGDNASIFFGGDSDNTRTLTVSDFSVSVIPEPGTLCLIGAGALALLRRRKNW